MDNRKYKMYHSIWTAVDLLFPPHCGGCDKLGSGWCETCQNTVKILNGIVCEICGLPQEKPGICGACLVSKPRFHSLRAWTVFDGPIQRLMHQLKYRRNLSLGDAIAAEMLPFVQDLGWRIDAVVPIPLGKQRKRERGYNQVAMIALPLALGLELQYLPRALARRKETRSQVGLSREERHTNVHDAFQASSGVRGKNVLIMDDVSTTGSTLSSGADALYASGANDVYALTVARALPHHDLRQV
jgi:ComF family protein